jgi:hypothetical protein
MRAVAGVRAPKCKRVILISVSSLDREVRPVVASEPGREWVELGSS